MDHFVVSARKYRPVTFDTVVGQSAITTTLKNAIRNNHLAQAFLFCGSRGVGKTTCARILAKTINCQNLGADIEPCGECESCKSFEGGQSLNIYELDAASNNSVDDIRHLIDQVRFAPQMGEFKVYIIDEVHMLSQAAFNAFLKTLEEPPKHAIFILATTEKHKIIPTILSRCQIFDFHRIQVADIREHLAGIAQKEGIQAEKDALHIIAQKADGAMRDGLSIFDQIVSFSGSNITYKDVIDNLNILDYDYYFKVGDALMAHNISQALLIFNEILQNGFDGHNFINGLAEHFRNLLVCKDAATLELLEVGDNIRERYREQSAQWAAPLLVQALSLTNQCDINYKSSKNKRLLVELTLLQLASVGAEKKSPDVNELEIDLLPVGFQLAEIQSSSNTFQQKPAAAAAMVAEPPANYGRSGIPQPTPAAPAPPPPAPPPKVAPKRNFSYGALKTKSSLNALLSDEKKKKGAAVEEETDFTGKPADAFDKETFLAAWSTYADMVKKLGKSSFYTTMKKHEPKLVSMETVEVLIDNELQERELKAEKQDMMNFLRQRLNNYHFDVVPRIADAPEEKKLYTSHDKFGRLVEKNPLLRELKSTLNLELE